MQLPIPEIEEFSNGADNDLYFFTSIPDFPFRVTLLPNNNLQIANVQPEDAGEYQCSATNAVGSLNSKAVVTVIGKRREDVITVILTTLDSSQI